MVILTGTDPASGLGGISTALPGYFRALETAGISYLVIPTHHPAIAGGKWRLWLAAFPRLVREICAARRKGDIVTVYAHPGPGISLFRQFFVLICARLLGARTVMQMHPLEFDGYLDHPVKRLLFRLTLSPAQALGVLTPWWQRRLTAGGIRKPMFVVPNPLPKDLEARALSARRVVMNPDKLTLLSLARLVPGKGVDEVIEAMPLLPDEFELIVAGDGPLREKLVARMQQLGLEQRVRFAGWVAGEEKQRLFDAADVFVLPSRYDSFGMGFLEAMANGLPVVAAEWGAIPDVVPHGRCGLLVRERTPQALAQAILKLRDVELRKQIGVEAKRWVLERFSVAVVVKEVAAMLQAVTKEERNGID